LGRPSARVRKPSRAYGRFCRPRPRWRRGTCRPCFLRWWTGDARGFVLAHRRPQVAARLPGRARAVTRSAPHLHTGVDAVIRLKGIGEDQVLGRASQEGVGAFGVFGYYEQLGRLQGRDDHVAQLRGRFASVEAVDIHPADGQQMAQRVVLTPRGGSLLCRGGSRGREPKSQAAHQPFPALRASSSWNVTLRPVRASRLTSRARMSFLSTRKIMACCRPCSSL